MKSILLTLALSVILFTFVGHTQVFQDDFTGTDIDTSKWNVVKGHGTITQDDMLILDQVAGVSWDDCYVTSVPAFPATSDGKVLQLILDIPMGDYNLLGFYPSGSFGGYSSQYYGIHWNPKLYAMEGGNDWTHTDDVARPAPLSVRMTLGSSNGALFEYDYLGSGWVAWRDTRDEGTGAAHPPLYRFYYMVNAGPLGLDNFVLQYVDPPDPGQMNLRIPPWPPDWHNPPTIPTELSDIENLRPKGQRYQQHVPDTLDLAERARLSVRILSGNTAVCNLIWKNARMLPKLRTMCGSEENLQEEASIVQSLLNSIVQQANQPEAYFFGPGYGGHGPMLLNWYRRDRNPKWLEWIEYLATMMDENAIRVQNRAYYPPSSLRTGPNSWYYADDRGEPPIPYEPPEEPYMDQQGFEGTVKWEQAIVMKTLLRDSLQNGNSSSGEAAEEFANFCLQPNMWEDTSDLGYRGHEHGVFAGHFHGNMTTHQALLEYAVANSDWKAIQIVREAYDHARHNGVVLMGWFPSWVTPEKFGRPSTYHGLNETCGVADTLILAVQLCDYGLGDYWDDVDSIVRNHLTEQQFIDAQKMSQCFPQGTDIESLVGGFGMGTPTTIPPAVYSCCSANGSLALYYAWHGITRFDGNTAVVNLLLNRASAWLDVDSYLPYEGKVVIRNKKAKTMRVRIPYWVEIAQVASFVGDASVNPAVEGRYLIFPNLNPEDIIRIEFPIREWSDNYFIHDRNYNLTFRGSTLVDIQPRSSGDCPLYQRDHLRSSTAPIHMVERFVTDYVLPLDPFEGSPNSGFIETY